MYTIYALIDPRDYTVHYVGQTTDVYQRFNDHVNCNGNNFIKNAWVVEMRSLNKMIIMETLEEVETYQEALERETYWVKHFKVLLEPLSNATHRPVTKKARKIQIKMRSRVEVAPSPFEMPTIDLDKFLLPATSGFKQGEDDRLLNRHQIERLIMFYQGCGNVNKSLEQIRDERGRGLGGRYTRHASFVLEQAGLKKKRA